MDGVGTAGEGGNAQKSRRGANWLPCGSGSDSELARDREFEPRHSGYQNCWLKVTPDQLFMNWPWIAFCPFWGLRRFVKRPSWVVVG